jgi:hypothetical protein
VNKYRFSLNQSDKFFNIPIEINFDTLGRNDLIDEYQKEVLEQIINPIEDFEVTRFAHKTWIRNNQPKSEINYKFYFFDRSGDMSSISPINASVWKNDYVFTDNPNFISESFNDAEIYYSANSFKRSFFKLDLYDTKDTETQQIYATIIIPTQQGQTRNSLTTPFSGGGPIIGPTIPDIAPGGEDILLNVTDENSTTASDGLTSFFDSYPSTFTNCDGFSITKYIALDVYIDMDYPNTDYKITIGGICYNLTNINNGLLIINPPVGDYIPSISLLSVGDCECPPPPSNTPTPTPSNTPPPPSSTPTPTPTSTPPNSPGTGGEVNPNPGGIGTPEIPSLTTAPPNVKIKKPNFVLDYLGDKEGYFIYWLKNPNYINIDTFYMSAKFFNAKTGQFIRMMNKRQNLLTQRFTFDKSKYFYYKVVLDYENYEYEIRDTETDQRVGTDIYEINWYEYVNPS